MEIRPCLTANLARQLASIVSPRLQTIRDRDTQFLDWRHTLRQAALASGGVGHRLIGTAFEAEGRSRTFDLGMLHPLVAPSTASVARNPEYMAVPAITDEPTLVVTLRQRLREQGSVLVEHYDRGNRHGFTDETPAMAQVEGGLLTCFYYYQSIDLSEVVSNPTRSALRTEVAQRGGAFDMVFPDRRHRDIIDMIRFAEDRHEAVVISPDNLPGLHAVRAGGSVNYRLINDVEHAQLLTSWAKQSLPIVSTRHSPELVKLMRKVGGLIDGASLRDPGVCVSTLVGSAEPLIMSRYFVNGHQQEAACRSAADIFIATLRR